MLFISVQRIKISYKLHCNVLIFDLNYSDPSLAGLNALSVEFFFQSLFIFYTGGGAV